MKLAKPATVGHVAMLVVCVAVLVTGMARAAPSLVDEMVAEVNGRAIMASEVFGLISSRITELSESGDPRADALIFRLKLQVLKQRIEDLLIYDDAVSKLGEPQLEYLDTIAEQNLQRRAGLAGSMERFKEMLKQAGSSLDLEREREKERLVLEDVRQREIDQRIVISPSELAAYYAEHRDDFAKPKEVRIRQIDMPFDEYDSREEALEAADLVLRKTKGGEDFAELAKQYSKGPNASQGGLYDFVERGDLRYREIEDIAFALSVGEVSPILETVVGFHVVKLEDVKEPTEPDFLLVQEEIRKILRERQAEALFRKLIERLEKRSSVKITWREYVERAKRR